MRPTLFAWVAGRIADPPLVGKTAVAIGSRARPATRGTGGNNGGALGDPTFVGVCTAPAPAADVPVLMAAGAVTVTCTRKIRVATW